MSRVRWGVLGCADFARRRTIPALLETPSAELVAVASRVPGKAEAFRRDFQLARAFDSYEALLDDPGIEAVYIPLPNSLHGEWMIRAAGKGKHAVSEKPFTTTAAEAERVAEAASRHGVRVMEGFMWRLHSQHLRARAAVDNGSIGEVVLVRASFSIPMPASSNIRLSPELGGGSIMDLGCYPVSAARFYFAAEPADVHARIDTHPRFGVDVRMSAILQFPAGRALIDCAFGLPYRTDLEIVGDGGTIRIPKPWLPDPEATIQVNGETVRLPGENQYVSQFEHFSRCILDGVPPLYGPEDAVRQMRVLDSILRSR